MNKRKTTRSALFRPYPSGLGRLFKSRSLSSIPENSSSTNISFDLETVNMATPLNEQPNSIGNPVANIPLRLPLESLRIPDAIKDLPTYEGNPRLLNEFINNVEEILLHIRAYDATPQGQILLRAIRNKIIGQANEVLNMYGTPLIWDDIKQNLILHYSDKRTETSLIRDLHNIRQKFNNVEKFYSEIIEIQASLFNNIQIHERDERVVKAKKDLYAEMCLNSFLIGLREPLGSTIRASKPDSLAEAFSLCIKEQNIFYMKTDPTIIQNKWQPRPNNSFYNGSRYNNRFAPFPQQNQITYNNKYIRPQQSQEIVNYNSQPMQRRINSNFSNQNYNQNTFKGNTFKGYSKPEPMDVSSSYIKTQAPTTTQRSFRTDQTMRTLPSDNQYKRGELFNFQNNNSPKSLPPIVSHQQNLDQYHELVEDNNNINIEDDTNFQHFASNNRQDT